MIFGSNLSLASNWRPIAILPITYKILSQVMHERMKYRLDAHQSCDQTGLRAGIRLEDALAVFETIASRANEWQILLFIASLDLRKAFDRVLHSSIFEALRQPDIHENEIALLKVLHAEQRGTANGSRFFRIARGVKQGDNLSLALFNATIEMVFRRWKCCTQGMGIMLDEMTEPLTNT